MPGKIPNDVLLRHWVHSHEEDTDAEIVLRPAGYPFPPSRGRTSFELKPDGSLVDHGIGAVDQREQVEGRWQLEGDNRLAFYKPSESRPYRVLRVVSADRARLVIRK
jgi:hypothetical protein